MAILDNLKKLDLDGIDALGGAGPANSFSAAGIDSFIFSIPAHTPEWTNPPAGDPGPAAIDASWIDDFSEAFALPSSPVGGAPGPTSSAAAFLVIDSWEYLSSPQDASHTASVGDLF